MTSPTNKKRRFQFGLRTLILFFIASVLCISWIVNEIRIAKHEQAVVDQLAGSSVGARYEYKFQFAEDSFLRQPADWLSTKLNCRPFYRIEEFYFNSQDFNRNPALGELTNLDILGQLRCLKKIEIEYCVFLKHLNGFKSLEKLESLELYHCDSLENVDGLANSPLRELRMYQCTSLKSIKGLRSVDTLEFLSIGGSEALTSLSGLERCKNIKYLELVRFDKLRSADQVGALSQLTDLLIYDTPVENISFLRRNNALKSIKLHDLGEVRNVDPIAPLRQLEELSLAAMPKLTDISGLCDLPNLAEVTFNNVHRIPDLSPLATLPALTDLRFFTCNGFENVDGLGGASSLESVFFSGCGKLESLEALSKLPNLKNLTVYVAPQLKVVGVESEFPTLENLTLVGIPEIVNADFIAQCPSLVLLRIENCVQLERPDLSGLDQLKFLITDLKDLTIKEFRD